MHLAVKRHLFDNRCPICLQRAPIVMNRNPRYLGDNPIGCDRRHTPRPKLILPVLPPATNQVIAFVKLPKHARNINRIILQITVHTDDILAAGIFKPCRHRRRLPCILLKPENPQNTALGNCAYRVRFTRCRILEARAQFLVQCRKHREGRVSATIIYEQHLVGYVDFLAHRLNFFKQRTNVLFFVVNRHNNREKWVFLSRNVFGQSF